MGRPGYSRTVWREFWAGVAAGSSVEVAALACGVSRPVAYRHFAASGGVMPTWGTPVRAGARRRLQPEEREEIALLHAGGLGPTAIGQRIGRDKATISRELARNTSTDGVYRPGRAQRLAEDRARHAGTMSSPAKLATHLALRRQVQAMLQENLSPEQIAGRLRREFPDDPEMWVSHETIYQSLYIQARGGLKRELTTHLRTTRTYRRPRKQTQARTARAEGGPLRNTINISQRPAEVEDRAVPGHWEGDLITGAENKTAIGTLVERTTGYLLLLHLRDDHTALTVQHAIAEAMATLPEVLRKTLTWDRGSEMANHAQIAEATGLDIYFCDPHSPWQRGTNENTNGLLRQYFPKGTDLSIHGPGILERVQIEINNRPRKRLDYATPAEALDQLLSTTQTTGVADAG